MSELDENILRSRRVQWTQYSQYNCLVSRKNLYVRQSAGCWPVMISISDPQHRAVLLLSWWMINIRLEDLLVPLTGQHTSNCPHPLRRRKGANYQNWFYRSCWSFVMFLLNINMQIFVGLSSHRFWCIVSILSIKIQKLNVRLARQTFTSQRKLKTGRILTFWIIQIVITREYNCTVSKAS